MLPFPSPGDFPNPGSEPGSPKLRAVSLLSEPPGKSEESGYLPSESRVTAYLKIHLPETETAEDINW